MEKINEKVFLAERAKTGRATCKKCKEKCENGVVRIAKLMPNPFSDSEKLKHWYHVDCIFETFKTQRATTRKIESPDDIEGWDALKETERDMIIEKLEKDFGSSSLSQEIKVLPIATTSTSLDNPRNCSSSSSSKSNDNLFRTFRDICDEIAGDSRYSVKSEILHKFLTKGTNGKRFEGNLYLWIKMLLPSASKRIYNLQSKQIVKLFSRLFKVNHQEMLIDLEQGDVSETVRKHFELSKHGKKIKTNHLTLEEVDHFLDYLSTLSKEDDQIEAFRKFCTKCTGEDLKMVIRLIKHDLRINAGPRHVLDALAPNAFSTFQSSRNLEMVVNKFAPLIMQNKIISTDNIIVKSEGISGISEGGVELMSPISPMLAEACKSVEKAVIKNPEGMYSEVKYDGERVQIHKKGNEFKFFSRNLKPVQDHKISRCKEFIPKVELTELIGDYCAPKLRPGPITDSDKKQRLEKVPHFIFQLPDRKTKDCAVCSKPNVPGERKRTSYFCDTCDRKPGLHPGNCFKRYHTVEDYKM